MIVRILVGAALIALLITMLALGGLFELAMLTLAAVISIYEMGRVLKAGGYQPCLWPLYGFAALSCVALAYGGWAGMGALAVLCLLCVFAEQVFNRARRAEDTICSLFICIYPLALYGILMLIAAWPVYALSRAGLLLAFAGPLAGDTAAYFVGTSLGRRKLCPHISPKKTVEGSLGGLLGGALGGLLTYIVCRIAWGGGPGLGGLLLAGLLCGGVGQIGDLYASTLKRWVELKDYGWVFPGHGGMMDRFDSVLMCAPLVLLWLGLQ